MDKLLIAALLLIPSMPMANPVPSMTPEGHIYLVDKSLIQVMADNGGSINDRLVLLEHFIEKDMTVEILGLCESACTMFLSLENTCVAPTAQLMFHGPYPANPFAPFDEEQILFWSMMLTIHYPEVLQEWFMSEGRFTETWFTGLDLIKMGVPACD